MIRINNLNKYYNKGKITKVIIMVVIYNYR